jgi:hypothetical protein
MSNLRNITLLFFSQNIPGTGIVEYPVPGIKILGQKFWSPKDILNIRINWETEFKCEIHKMISENILSL